MAEKKRSERSNPWRVSTPHKAGLCAETSIVVTPTPYGVGWKK